MGERSRRKSRSLRSSNVSTPNGLEQGRASFDRRAWAEAFESLVRAEGVVPDQPKAIREMVRVTKPGGRVLLIAFIDALRGVNPDFEGLPSDPPPLEFQISDPGGAAGAPCRGWPPQRDRRHATRGTDRAPSGGRPLELVRRQQSHSQHAGCQSLERADGGHAGAH